MIKTCGKDSNDFKSPHPESKENQTRVRLVKKGNHQKTQCKDKQYDITGE